MIITIEFSDSSGVVSTENIWCFQSENTDLEFLNNEIKLFRFLCPNRCSLLIKVLQCERWSLIDFVQYTDVFRALSFSEKVSNISVKSDNCLPI